MNEKQSITRAFIESKGPKNTQESRKLFLKGFFMGAADIVPGVSGGTIAFITGIYQDLMNAIKSINLIFLKDLFQFKIAKAISESHLKFLIILFLGIVSAIVGFSHLMSYFLSNFPEYIWSVFFGLISASVFIIWSKIEEHSIKSLLFLFIGAVLAYFLVALIPISSSEAYWFVFLSGVIAISAMILPGLSGAFILLVLGKYQFMIEALKNPFLGDNLIVVSVFVIGCMIGLLSFSRVAAYLLKKHYNFTVAFLAGMVIGSLRKVWPWKETLEEKVVDSHIFVIREKNIIPEFSESLFLQLILLFAAFVLVWKMNSIKKRG